MSKKKPDHSTAGLRRSIAQRKRAERERAAGLKAALGRGRPNAFGGPLGVALAALKSGPQLLEFALERFWHERMPPVLRALDKAYDAAVAKGWRDRETAASWGTDNRLWFEATELGVEHVTPEISLEYKYRVLVHETQSRDYLYVWDEKALAPKGDRMGFRELHCRRVWRRWQDHFDPKDKWDARDEQAFKDGVAAEGRSYVVRKGGNLIEEYADDERGDAFYPDRPSLAFYRAKGFEMKYGDARDPGYVFSWKESSREVDDAIHTHRMLSRIEDCLLPDIEHMIDHPHEVD